jgi:hypothetical protein
LLPAPHYAAHGGLAATRALPREHPPSLGPDALGIYAMPGRRAALTDLAAKMPAAVLADLLHLSPGTSVRWVHQAGGDWSRYAAELARERVHQA